MTGATNIEKAEPNVAIQPGISSALRRTIAVEAVGVIDVVPDECHLLVSVSSSKGTISQAKDSVERRVQYILQAVQNSQIQDSDVKTFRSLEAGFTCNTELYISSSDLSKLEVLSETLLNKLGESSVTIHPVKFSTSQSMLSRARTQAANSAVQNARRKAVEMVRLVEGSLGSPLSIEQVSSSEEPSIRAAYHEFQLTTNIMDAIKKAMVAMKNDKDAATDKADQLEETLLEKKQEKEKVEEERDSLLKRLAQLEADTVTAKSSLEESTAKLQEWNEQKEKHLLAWGIVLLILCGLSLWR